MTRKTKDEMLELIRDREANIVDLNKSVEALKSSLTNSQENCAVFRSGLDKHMKITEAALSRATRAERRVVLLLDQMELLHSNSMNEEGSNRVKS